MSIPQFPAEALDTVALLAPSRAVQRRRVRWWMLVHALPLVMLPVFTLTVGPLAGIDAAAIGTHAVTILGVPLLQARLLRLLCQQDIASAIRGVLALGAAIVTAMVLMSTIDLAGYDAAATPIAMSVAGALHGTVLAWPLRRRGKLAVWVGASAAGWLLGTALFRLLLLVGLGWQVSGQLLYGYAYAGGHNELLWVGGGLLGYGIVTAVLLSRFPAGGGDDAARVSRQRDANDAVKPRAM